MELEKIKTFLYIILILVILWQLTLSENSLLGKQEASFELDGNTYVISNMGNAKHQLDPADLKNVGTRISCDTLKEVTGQQVLQNHEINGTKSFISGKKLSVSCVEPYSKIAIDYLPEGFYSYGKSSPSKDVYEFYDRVALNKYKEDELKKGGMNYFTIPYNVDHDNCETGKCRIPDMKTRKNRIRDYIQNRIENIL